MKRLIYAIDDTESLDEVGAMMRQRHLRGWHWNVLADPFGFAERRGLPLLPIWRRKAILRTALQGGFWGVGCGGLLALLAVSLGQLPNGELRSSALLSFPISFACFGAWVGGLLGLSQDHVAVKPFLPEVEAGHYLVLIKVREVDLRLVKKIMAMGGARKLGERSLGLSWRRVFPGSGQDDE